MNQDSQYLQQLAELIDKDELNIFLGPDLPHELTGVPGWAELAERLAERSGFPPAATWPETAARYEQTAGRRNLIDWLDHQVNGQAAGPLYHELAELPISHYVTATYDNLLQTALDGQGGSPANFVVEEEDLDFIRTGRPTIVKLLGALGPGRRDSLLVTAGDLHGLTQLKAKLLAQEVLPQFWQKSLFIIGQDVNADYFKTLYYHELPQASRMRRQAYALWPGLESWEKQTWAGDKLTIIDAHPLTFLKELHLYLDGSAPAATPPSGTSSEPTGPQPEPKAETRVDLAKLRLMMTDLFGETELQNIAFDLGVDYESLPAVGKEGKARELIVHLDRKKTLPELIKACRRRRPKAPWDEVGLQP